MKLCKDRKGYTLTEALVGIVLLALTTIVFFSCFMTAFANLRRVMELRTASLVLQEQVSATRTLTFSDIQNMGSSFTSGAMSSLNNASGSVTQSFYHAGGNSVKITFALDWTAFDGTPAHRSIATVMTEDGINKR